MAEKQTAGRNELGTFAPKFAELNDDVLFGDIWSRENQLSLRDRSLVTVTSYSKKAFPWDNACIESFHSIIKREWLNRFKIRDYKQAYQLIFEYLEAFYNTKRIHSHCNYMSPNEFERVYERIHTEAELLAG